MDENEERGEFSAACEIEMQLVRAENGLENENEDSVVEHSKEQELESRKICHIF